jgi:hypothetical protein
MSKSGRGGTRTGGGRPSPWLRKPTCTIRVPEELAESLLEIARSLDQGSEDVIIVDPKSLKIDRQKKQEYLLLSKLRLYKHSSGRKMIGLEDLLNALQALLLS